MDPNVYSDCKANLILGLSGFQSFVKLLHSHNYSLVGWEPGESSSRPFGFLLGQSPLWFLGCFLWPFLLGVCIEPLPVTRLAPSLELIALLLGNTICYSLFGLLLQPGNLRHGKIHRWPCKHHRYQELLSHCS